MALNIRCWRDLLTTLYAYDHTMLPVSSHINAVIAFAAHAGACQLLDIQFKSVCVIYRLPTAVRNVQTTLQIAIRVHEPPMRLPKVSYLRVIKLLFPRFIECLEPKELLARAKSFQFE